MAKTTNNQQRTLLKTKPNKANLHFTAENAEYAEKKDICVSDCPIEIYALYHISPCSGLGHPVDLRTRRLMKNKAKQSQFSNATTGSLQRGVSRKKYFI